MEKNFSYKDLLNYFTELAVDENLSYNLRNYQKKLSDYLKNTVRIQANELCTIYKKLEYDKIKRTKEKLSLQNKSLFEQSQMFRDPRCANKENTYLEYISGITNKIKQSKSLTIIEPIKDSEFFFLFCSLPMYSSLLFLTINNITFTIDLNLVILCKTIGSLPLLKSLNISNCKAPNLFKQEIVARFLGFSLIQLPDLENLCLTNNEFLKANLGDLIEINKGCGIFNFLNRLSSIKLGSYKKTKKSEWFSKQKSSFPKSIVDSSTSCFDISESDLEISEDYNYNSTCSLMEILRYLHPVINNLKVLHLPRVKMISYYIFHLIVSSHSLESLDLSYNKIEIEHLNYVSTHYNQNQLKSRIKKLLLSGNSLGEKYRIAVKIDEIFSWIFFYFPLLEELALDQNGLVDNFEHFQRDQIISLKRLILDFNDFSNPTGNALSVIQTLFPQLLYISLKSTKITKGSLVYIIENWKIFGTKINLRNNFLFDDLRELERFLEKYGRRIEEFNSLNIRSKISGKNKSNVILDSLSEEKIEELQRIDSYLKYLEYSHIVY